MKVKRVILWYCCCCVFWWQKQSICFSFSSYHLSMLVRSLMPFLMPNICWWIHINFYHTPNKSRRTLFLYVLNDDETVSYLVFVAMACFMSFYLSFSKSFDIFVVVVFIKIFLRFAFSSMVLNKQMKLKRRLLKPIWYRSKAKY